MPAAVEIVATYLREFQRWPDYNGGTDTILAECWYDNGKTADTLTVKTQAEVDELVPEQDYRFRGQWSNHPRYGRQFHASSFTMQRPASRTAVVNYLTHAGKGLGFGEMRAIWVWEQYGSEAVRMIREEPDRIVEEMSQAKSRNRARLRWELESAREMAVRLQESEAVESSLLDLTDILANRGFRRTLPRDIIRIRGNAGADEIRADAYDMLFWTDPKTGRRLPGLGFKQVDKLYLDLGGDPASLRRQSLAAWHAVREDGTGHVWYPRTVAVKGIEDCICGAAVRPDEAIAKCLEDELLVETATDGIDGPLSESGGCKWYAEGRSARNESVVAERVAEAMEEGTKWPGIEL